MQDWFLASTPGKKIPALIFCTISIFVVPVLAMLTILPE
jgi:hypothetical protein